MGREYGSLAKQVVESIGVFCLTDRQEGAIYTARTTNYILNAIGKTPSFPNV